jgi:hypothetical protein
MTETMTLENGPMSVPSGGIASFRMSDEDLANLDREQDEQLAEEVYGSEGISRFTEIASDMAGLGRYGDDVVVHAQTGELVIPKRILDESPEIREVVYQALREQGIEDPEQYVVGSGSASINPNTGLAEYGFFKGIKKAFKQVVKVVKKIAPIVLPIALAMTPLGAIYGAALGSGIASLMQGGSIKDALKSAAISGLSGAAFQGFTGPGTFSENVSSSLSAPGARFSQTLAGVTGPESFFRPYVSMTPPSGQAPADFRGADYQGVPDSAYGQVNNAGNPVTADQIQLQDTSVNTSGYSNSGAPEYSMAGQANMQTAATPQNAATTAKFAPNGGPITPNNAGGQGGATTFNAGAPGSQPTEMSFLDKTKQTIFGGPEKTPMDFYNDPKFASDVTNQNLRYDMARDVAAKTQNNILQKFAPYALTGGALMYATGGFDTPEEEPVDILDRNSDGSVRTGQDVYRENEAKYKVGDLYSAPISYTTPNTPYQSYANINPYQSYANINPFTIPSIGTGNPFYRPSVQTAAQGGEIFPRRNGGIMPNEGIPGQDSVRAMLMPGEFVMTTDAVKGAGGIPNMYHMMSALERKGRMA